MGRSVSSTFLIRVKGFKDTAVMHGGSLEPTRTVSLKNNNQVSQFTNKSLDKMSVP